MNGVLEFFDVKFKQTSKGVWYCDGFTATNKHHLEAIDVSERVMIEIETVLKRRNAEAEK